MDSIGREGEQRGEQRQGVSPASFKKQFGKTCRHFPGLQPWMSDTEEFPFLECALQKPAVNVKKMENLKIKVEWKVTEMVEWGGAGRQGSGVEYRAGVQG